MFTNILFCPLRITKKCLFTLKRARPASHKLVLKKRDFQRFRPKKGGIFFVFLFLKTTQKPLFTFAQKLRPDNYRDCVFAQMFSTSFFVPFVAYSLVGEPLRVGYSREKTIIFFEKKTLVNLNLVIPYPKMITG